MNNCVIDIFVLERDKAVKSLDVAEFRKFYERWYKRGIYKLSLPDNDRVIEITMRKMVLMMKNSTEQERKDAKVWLLERGLSYD